MNASPQGDRHFPEVSSRVRLELLLNFWEARARSAAGGRDQGCRPALMLRSAPRQALESPITNFTRSPRRLIMEWHAEAHLLPPWERAVEA